MKFNAAACLEVGQQSLPARGAWVEIMDRASRSAYHVSRSPHGERGLKSDGRHAGEYSIKVAPRTGSVG